MKKHVTAVGAIQIGLGIIWFMAAIIVFVVLNFTKEFAEVNEIQYTILRFLSISIPVFVGFLSILALAGGIGMLMWRSWARYLGIVVAALGCLAIPIGTLIGVYSLWVLFQDDTVIYCKT